MDKRSDKTIKTITRKARVARTSFDKNGRKISKHARNFLGGRLDNLRMVRRGVIIWLTAVAVLTSFALIQILFAWQSHQMMAPADGGVYAEGVVDKISTLNPIFATTKNEIAGSSLMYSGMFSYDRDNKLAGNLVSTWSTKDGKTWDFKLRENAFWSDGQKISADDIVFTMNLIKNSAVGSPLYGIFAKDSVSKINDHEIKIELPTAYMSLPYTLTFGILPQHSLKDISPASVRNVMNTDFSQNIVSGPFKYSSRENLANGQTIWKFSPNEKFSQNARISSLTIRTYESQNKLIDGLNSGEINAASAVRMSDAANLKADRKLTQETLNDGVFVIFNTNSSAVSDQSVREALRLGADRETLRKSATTGELTSVDPLDSPIANGVYDSVDALKQPDFNLKAAEEKLDNAGWKINEKSRFREKDGKKLTINLVTIQDTDYARVAKELVSEWKKLGVDAQLTESDQSSANDSYLTPRNYDVLVYDLHLGADPDEFAYWSSTEATEKGLNFANYSNKRADLALNGGRQQFDETARKARYVDFVKRWQQDIPAIALYQPKYYYITTGSANSVNNSPLVDSTARFRDVSEWTVNSQSVNTTP